MNILDQLIQGKVAMDLDSGAEGAGAGDDSIEDLLDNVDLSQLSEEELKALMEEAGEGNASAGASEEEMGEDPEVVAEKMSSASDFLGRVQAHAFIDELNKTGQGPGREPDGTGPHGRGLGPGKGKGDGAWMTEEERKKMEEEKKRKEQEKEGSVPTSKLLEALSILQARS